MSTASRVRRSTSSALSRAWRTRIWQPAAAAAGLAAAGYVATVDPEQPGHYPTCPFLSITGLYCPGCGSLRAVHALLHADLGTALQRNPLTVLAVPVLIVLLWRWAAYRLGGPHPLPRLPGWLGWALIAVVVGFGVLRNLPGLGWLAP